MSSSRKNPRIPKKGPNPEKLRIALAQKDKATADSTNALGNLANMVGENARILGQLVVMFEVLKEKGLITNDEINDKFRRLQEEQAAIKAEEERIAKEKAAEEEKREAKARNELDAERKRLAEEANKKSSGDSENPSGSSIQPQSSRGDESNK